MAFLHRDGAMISRVGAGPGERVGGVWEARGEDMG